jgi:hypothetical protein
MISKTKLALPTQHHRHLGSLSFERPPRTSRLALWAGSLMLAVQLFVSVSWLMRRYAVGQVETYPCQPRVAKRSLKTLTCRGLCEL